MSLLVGCLAAIVAVLLGFPQTQIGRGLRRWLIEAPAARLNRIRRGKAVFYGLLAILGLVLLLLFETAGVRLFGFMLPDTLVWFAMFDVGVFVDALLITAAILATNGLRAIRGRATVVSAEVARIARRRVASARRAIRRHRRQSEKSADDEGQTWAAYSPYRAFSIA